MRQGIITEGKRDFLLIMFAIFVIIGNIVFERRVKIT